VQAGNPAWPAEPNVWGMLRSTWNFGAYWSTDAGTNGATEDTLKELGALVAVLAGLQEQTDITPVTTVWPKLGTALYEARGREAGGSTSLLDQGNAADGTPSAILRLSEIARLLSGKFPDTGTLWWYEQGNAVTLYDLYQQQSGLTDDPADPDGVNWIDYVSDLVGIPTDLADLLDSFGLSPGKLKKDGLMIALIAVEFMNLSMTSNLLINLIGKDSIVYNSPGAPAATHDYLEAILKSTRGMGIQRSETDWAGQSVGAGLPPDGTPPGDSILTGIRGNVEASASRNIIDSMQGRLDALLQGSDLGDGRVNLFNLDQRLDTLLTELQIGQIFSKLNLIEQNVAIAVDGNQHTGKINLRDVKASIEQLESILGDVRGYLLGIEGDTEAIKPAVDFILAELNKLMDTSGYTDRTNLHDLLEQLICICKSTQDLVILQPADEPYEILPEPADSSASSVDCQRTRWLLDGLRVIGEGIFARHPVTKQMIQDAYQRAIGTVIGGERASIIASEANSHMRSLGANWIAWNNWFATGEDALRCVIVNESSPAAAYNAWNVALDGLGAGALSYATVLKNMLWGDILNQLFATTLPLYDQDLSPYSTDCSDCSGGGTVVPDAPPGGWGTKFCYGRFADGSPNAHLTDPGLVAFWWETVDGDIVSSEQFGTDSGNTRWDITDNLRGYKVISMPLNESAALFEVYDGGTKLAESTAANPVISYEFTADTSMVTIRITSGWPGSVCIKNPDKYSGWPFP
jgi:hypothetical protein